MTSLSGLALLSLLAMDATICNRIFNQYSKITAAKNNTKNRKEFVAILADLRRRFLYLHPCTELSSLSTVKINIEQFSSPTTSGKRIT